MSKPKNIEEAIKRAREYGTPTYLMLADEIERLQNEQKEAARILNEITEDILQTVVDAGCAIPLPIPKEDMPPEIQSILDRVEI